MQFVILYLFPICSVFRPKFTQGHGACICVSSGGHVETPHTECLKQQILVFSRFGGAGESKLKVMTGFHF